MPSTTSIMLNISKHLSTYEFRSSLTCSTCRQANRYVFSSCTTRGLGVPSHCIRCFQSSSSRYIRSCSCFFRDNSDNMAHVGCNRSSRSYNTMKNPVRFGMDLGVSDQIPHLREPGFKN